MHIKSIHLVNWCQHEDLKLELGPGLNGVIGSNGRGKSNFLDALRFIFTGESNNPGGKADNLRWGAKAGHVQVVVGIGDTDYRIKRWIKGSKVEMTWSDPTGDEQKIVKAAELQEKITALTGASPKVLLDAVFVPQGEIDSVLFQKPAERLKEFQRIFGLQGAADAYKFLGEESGRYHLTPGLSETLKETTDLLTNARNEFQTNLAEADELQANIDANAGAEDVLRRHTEGERQAQALRNAQDRVDAATRALSEADDAVADAHAAVEANPIEGVQDQVSNLQSHRAKLRHALDQWTTVEANRATLQGLQAQIADAPAVSPEEGQALEDAVGPAQRALAQAQHMASPMREPTPSEVAAKEAQKAANAALNAHIQAGAGINSDPKVMEMTREIDHIRAEIGAFETGVCPTCGQEVNGGPAAMAELKAKAEKLADERHHYCVRLEEQFENQKAKLVQASNAADTAVHEIEQKARAFFQGKYTEAQTAFDNAQAKLRDAQARQQRHINLAQQIQTVQQTLQGAPEEKPSAELLQKLEADLTALQAQLTKRQEVDRQLGRAIDKQESAANELGHAQSALQALSTDLDIPTQEEVEAARAAAEKVSQWRQSIGQINNSMASQKVAIQTRESEVKRLADRAREEATDQAWVEALRRVRDVLHPSKLPALVMQEYAKIINGQVDWYLSQWQAPFKIWINDDLAFRAWKPDDQGAEAEMDAARLSGGEKIVGSVSFRLAMSDTFARQAGLVVLDEPSNYLDKANIQHLQEVLLQLRRLSASSHRQVIVVTHEQSLMGFFDHTVQIGDGGSLAA